MTNPEIKVKRTRKTKKSSTDIQMLIESNTEQQYDVFDKQMIVNSITKECDMSEQEALSIANRVEETLLKSNFKNVSSSYIRSLVNQILGEQGYDVWIKYSSLSIPMYDVKQLIEEHNSENSNTGFSPESINLTLAGQILKQYALREVFDKEVSDAHLKGELHCHDLDFINRSYAFDGDMCFIWVRDKITKKEFKISIGNSFNNLISSNIKSDNGIIIKFFNNYEILDKDGWTDLIKIVEMVEDKDIYQIDLESGETIYVTEDHPCLKYIDGSPIEIMAKDLLIGDEMYVAKK